MIGSGFTSPCNEVCVDVATAQTRERLLHQHERGRLTSAAAVDASASTFKPEPLLLVGQQRSDRPVLAVGVREPLASVLQRGERRESAASRPGVAQVVARDARQVDDRRTCRSAVERDRRCDHAAQPVRRAAALRWIELAVATRSPPVSQPLDDRLPLALLVGPQQRDGSANAFSVVSPARRRARARAGPAPCRSWRASRAACFSALVKWRSLWRSDPSGFLPRSLSQLTLNFARSTPASTNGRTFSRTPSLRSGSQPIGCSASGFQRT